MVVLKGKRLCLHFDGTGWTCEEDMSISVKRERIAVSVTSPEFNDDHDVLLECYRGRELSKGRDQASTILQLLEYLEYLTK